MRNDSIIKTAVYRTQPPEWTKFTHIVLVYLQRVIGKENTFKEDIRGTAHTTKKISETHSDTQ